MQYLLKNIEWIFSGIGVLILTMVISFITKRRRKKEEIRSRPSIDNNSFNNSPFTNVTGENINYNQNIYRNNTIDENIDSEQIPLITSEDLVKTKENFLLDKKRLRTFIYRVITPAKNINKIIQIRHVVDEAEEKLKINYKVILQELKEMEQEGLIELFHETESKYESPYTRIILTKKFFQTIKSKL